MVGSITEILDFIRANDRFTLIPHLSPDGDCTGSALGLAGLIACLGKEAEVVCCDAVPSVYAFLPGADAIKRPVDAIGYPAVITVDCADKARLGGAEGLFDKAEHTACIDHHGTNKGFAAANWVRETAATGELIYSISKELGVMPTFDMANCLYTAIMTDTGCFAYSNVTSETMAIAGGLIACGADNARLNRMVYHTTPLAKAKLHAFAMGKLSLHGEGRIAVSALTKAEIDATGAKDEYTEGIVELLRDIEGVELAIFIKQSGDNAKVSLRAKERVNVSGIALQMDGGGHIRAAGYTHHNCGVDEAAARAIALGEEELARCLKA